MIQKPWKVGRDLFGETHVYDAGGDRITNDRLTQEENWKETCQEIAALPDLIDALEGLLEDIKDLLGPLDRNPNDALAAVPSIKAAAAALAKAKGEDNAERN